MRIMKRGDTTLKVAEHIMLKNFWEYYIEEPDEDGIAYAYVMGDYDELGWVSLKEIEPHIALRTQNFNEVMPAAGWQWV